MSETLEVDVVEPTEEMLQAAYREIERIDYISLGELRRAIKAALAAAPTTEIDDLRKAAEAAREIERLRGLIAEIERIAQLNAPDDYAGIGDQISEVLNKKPAEAG